MYLISNFREILYKIEKSFGFETDIKWSNTFVILFMHIFTVFWSWHYAFPVKWQTVIFMCLANTFSGLGVTCGVHRYWTHRSFKATLPLQILLLFMYASANQTSVRLWVRNHRLHHKVSDTAADPYNVTRGLFYAHIGWLMMKKHPESIRKGKSIDMSDIEQDPLLKWHERNILWVNPLCCFVLPPLVNVWLFGEAWPTAIAWLCFIRYIKIIHIVFTVNSLAHAYGYRPYNKFLVPAESWFVSLLTLGEGWHNYHHAFPYDYKAAETCDFLNFSTMFLNAVHKVGWAYDLKEATPEAVKSIADRLGDGTPIRAEA